MESYETLPYVRSPGTQTSSQEEITQKEAMKIKIYDGTLPDAHLCKSCMAAMIRSENSKEVTLCQDLPSPNAVIRGRVTRCSGYQSRVAYMAMAEFRANAWHLDKDEDGNLAWSIPADRSDSPVRLARRRRKNSLVRTIASNPPDPVVQ